MGTSHILNFRQKRKNVGKKREIESCRDGCDIMITCSRLDGWAFAAHGDNNIQMHVVESHEYDTFYWYRHHVICILSVCVSAPVFFTIESDLFWVPLFSIENLLLFFLGPYTSLYMYSRVNVAIAPWYTACTVYVLYNVHVKFMYFHRIIYVFFFFIYYLKFFRERKICWFLKIEA